MSEENKKEPVIFIKTVEHRASTDESLKLLQEMQEKALQSIIEKVVLRDNIFNGLAIYAGKEALSESVRFIGRFLLNGEEHTVDYSVGILRFSTRTEKIEGLLKEFCKGVSEVLTIKLMEKFLETNEFKNLSNIL